MRDSPSGADYSSLCSWPAEFRRRARFQYGWISPSTVLRILGTHLELFATPWYIESLEYKI